MRSHRRQPTRLPRLWDSPGKNTGVGCHFLLQCMKVKSESEVAQSCPTLRDPMNYSLPGSSVHGIFQARVLEWGAIAFSAIHHYTWINVIFQAEASCSQQWEVPPRLLTLLRYASYFLSSLISTYFLYGATRNKNLYVHLKMLDFWLWSWDENYIGGRTGNNKILHTLMMQKYNRMIAIFNHRWPVGFIIYTIVYIMYT